MSNGGTHVGTPPSPSVEKVTELVDKVTKDPVIREVLLSRYLPKVPVGDEPKTSPNTPLETDPEESPTSVTTLADIKEGMVAKAELSELEAWVLLPSNGDWDQDLTLEEIQKRLQELRPSPSPTPSSEGIGSPKETEPVEKPTPVEKPPTPEETFAASVRGHPLKTQLLAFYKKDGAFAAEARDNYDQTANPPLPEDLLKRLAQAGLLWRERVAYRPSKRGVGGQNGVVTWFYLTRAGGTDVGEWHVHWGVRNSTEKPGWKKGTAGAKVETSDETMKVLMKGAWGKAQSSGGVEAVPK